MAHAIAELTYNRDKTSRPVVTFTELLHGWIDKHFSQRRNGSKKLARLASFGDHQVSHRTTEAWIRRERTPGMHSIEILSARCDDLAAQLQLERQRLRDALR